MTWNFSTFFSFFFCFMFFSFLAVHFSHMKSPVQSREIASQHKTVHPLYDASFKY